MQITRSSRRGLIGLVAGLATAATLGAAQAQTTLEQAKADGYIRVGFANEAPYGFATPDGKLTGESPEVVKAVLDKMGIAQVDGVLTEFGSLIPGLQAGRFDIIAAGMFITPKRCEQIQFSEPTYGIGQAFLVSEGNPKGIKDYSSIADNSDLKLAVMAGAVEARLCQGFRHSHGPARRAARPVEPGEGGAGRPRRRGGADRAVDRRHGVEERRRRVDGALRHGGREVGRRPRRASASARTTPTSMKPSTPS